MKQLLKTVWIVVILCSCRQDNKPLKQNTDTIKAVEFEINNEAHAPLSAKQAISDTEGCSYSNLTNSLGEGLVIVPSTFEVFNDSLCLDRYMKWNMYSENQPEKIICTKFYKPDYGIMHFVCLEKSEKYFKVLINFSQVKYLPKKDTYKFVTWEKYILQSFGIRRTLTDVKEGHSGQAFRKSNREDAEIITLPEGQELLCPIEIKDNWIKVRYDCFYNSDNHPYEGEPCHNYIDKCEPSLTAWIKWREQNRILIDIFLMP